MIEPENTASPDFFSAGSDSPSTRTDPPRPVARKQPRVRGTMSPSASGSHPPAPARRRRVLHFPSRKTRALIANCASARRSPCPPDAPQKTRPRIGHQQEQDDEEVRPMRKRGERITATSIIHGSAPEVGEQRSNGFDVCSSTRSAHTRQRCFASTAVSPSGDESSCFSTSASGSSFRSLLASGGDPPPRQDRRCVAVGSRAATTAPAGGGLLAPCRAHAAVVLSATALYSWRPVICSGPFPLRISGMSWPCLSMYCSCSISLSCIVCLR